MADITAQDTIEKVNAFLQGRDSMERIITMECDYQSNKVSIIYVNSKEKNAYVLMISNLLLG